jgi:hypothetical protein
VKFWNNPTVVGKTPLLTTLLLEYANAGQLYRMWTEHTAAGQSMWSWLSVGTALWLWCNFYRVCCPDQKFTLRCTQFGVFMNLLVVLSVAYFRYVAGR